jgi:hypothetical protein
MEDRRRVIKALAPIIAAAGQWAYHQLIIIERGRSPGSPALVHIEIHRLRRGRIRDLPYAAHALRRTIETLTYSCQQLRATIGSRSQ